MTSIKRRVLFHRSWTKYNGGTSGGQLKVRDAFEHIRHSDHFAPFVYFGPETVWYDQPGNHWLPYREQALPTWDIRSDDLLFFSGLDWAVLPPDQRKRPPVPVINIAQPRHTDPSDKRHAYLKHPALRIAKSSIGKKILEDFGVNGPVFFIPDAIDLEALPAPDPSPDLDVLIVGLKNPKMAARIHRRLQWHNWLNGHRWKIAVQVPPKLPTRLDFLQLINRARIVAYLPLPASEGAEGFYLPALEGMAMGKLVICPYAVGNVDFCLPEQTCLQPDYSPTAITLQILRALKMPEAERQHLLANATAITRHHSLPAERKALLDLIHRADSLWQQKDLFHV
jgi:hypothetical protein